MGPGQSNAQAQPRVGASARASAPPEAQPGPQPEVGVLCQKPRDGREIRRPGARERRYIQRSKAAVVEAKQRIQLENLPTRTSTCTKGSPVWFSTLTPSKLAVGQEWESPGGAVATGVASAPPRRHICFMHRLLFRSGRIW